ncbi:hypothetical protein Salat_2401100 [Sesamum alatum]|uniref:Uncharacterized protein n=1 Tax=Sesamum alatum TaxID=300844 RepID=A0AAE2CF72_9LAMI|nr:hypothetical protein Salat_2401100 [Sesamum alatum]
MDYDAIFEANDWETIFKIVDNVVDEIRSQQPVVEGAEGDAVRGREGDTIKGGEGKGGETMRDGEGEITDAVRVGRVIQSMVGRVKGGEAMRGGECEIADAVRCGEGNKEDEVVENDRISVEIGDDGFSDSI